MAGALQGVPQVRGSEYCMPVRMINVFKKIIHYQSKSLKMKKMELNQMEQITAGGCGDTADKAIATIGFVASLASLAGPIGLAIAGPTALGMGFFSVICAYRK